MIKQKETLSAFDGAFEGLSVVSDMHNESGWVESKLLQIKIQQQFSF